VRLRRHSGAPGFGRVGNLIKKLEAQNSLKNGLEGRFALFQALIDPNVTDSALLHFCK
jgi:hypothetical protein